MSAAAPANQYPAGLTLIQNGQCPIGAVHPMACWTCSYGHATECHHPFDCEEANCSHSQVEESDCYETDFEDFEDGTLAAHCAIDREQSMEEIEAESDRRLTEVMAMSPEELDAEYDRQRRIEAGIEHVCAGCGCSETRACPGGCIWATKTLCSRCV